MRRGRSRSAGLVAVLAALVLLAGCGAKPPASTPSAPPPGTAAPSPLPPRPAQLRLDGVDPCRLLTPAQQDRLGIELLSVQGADAFNGTGKDCQWAHTGNPHDGYGASTDLRRGADYALRSQTGTQITQVDGYGAVTTTGGTADPATNCVVLIDVAPGQSLWALYDDSFHDQPNLTHEVSCQKAITAGQMMLGNLRALVH